MDKGQWGHHEIVVEHHLDHIRVEDADAILHHPTVISRSRTRATKILVAAAVATTTTRRRIVLLRRVADLLRLQNRRAAAVPARRATRRRHPRRRSIRSRDAAWAGAGEAWASTTSSSSRRWEAAWSRRRKVVAAVVCRRCRRSSSKRRRRKVAAALGASTRHDKFIRKVEMAEIRLQWRLPKRQLQWGIWEAEPGSSNLPTSFPLRLLNNGAHCLQPVRKFTQRPREFPGRALPCTP